VGRETVATALTVINGPVAVIECVATHVEARRTGAGSAVMRAVLAEARVAGARLAALGVVTANLPAMGLYSRLGFAPFGGYHYRRLDR
jgi:ribosomal protein S18 acetylase RimI-like enzyme